MWDVLGLRVFGANGGNAGVRGFTGFGESIVAGVKVLAFLERKAKVRMRNSARETGCGKLLLTLSLFCRRSLLFGSLPYRRKRRCSSAERD